MYLNKDISDTFMQHLLSGQIEETSSVCNVYDTFVHMLIIWPYVLMYRRKFILDAILTSVNMRMCEGICDIDAVEEHIHERLLVCMYACMHMHITYNLHMYARHIQLAYVCTLYMHNKTQRTSISTNSWSTRATAVTSRASSACHSVLCSHAGTARHSTEGCERDSIARPPVCVCEYACMYVCMYEGTV